MRRVAAFLVALLFASLAAAQPVPPPGSVIQNNVTPALGFTLNHCIGIGTGNKVIDIACSTGGSTITAGSTPTSGFASTGIIGTSSNVVAAYTVSGTGTVVALTAGPTFTGTTNISGVAQLVQVAETFTAPTISAGTLTVNLALGTVFNVSLNTNITTFTISNVVASKSNTFQTIFTADGTLRTIVWPTGTVWSGGAAPTMTSTLNKRDIVTLTTNDGGTTWFGTIVQNF